MNTNEDKIRFCVRYLLANGVDCSRFSEIAAALPPKPEGSYTLLKQQGQSFFTDVATGLRNLWPPGNKDGKWPWRESVPVLVDRLKFIWEKNELEDKYTVDDCLEAGRKYIAQFENSSVKYMQVLKYFIFKQKDTGTDEKGFIKKTYESTLVKMLQDNKNEKQESFDDFII